MSEDISNYMRLAMTICLLAAYVMSTIAVAFTGLANHQILNDRYMHGMQTANSSSLGAVITAKRISAVTAYKFLYTNGYGIGSLKITYLDGTISSDARTLLENAHLDVHVEMVRRGSTADYEITEVKR